MVYTLYIYIYTSIPYILYYIIVYTIIVYILLWSTYYHKFLCDNFIKFIWTCL